MEALSVTSIRASTSSSSRQQLSVTVAVNETVASQLPSTSTGCGSFVISQLIVGGAVILDQHLGVAGILQTSLVGDGKRDLVVERPVAHLH